MVEKNNEITYYTSNNYNKSNLICRYHPLPLLPEGGDYKLTPFFNLAHPLLFVLRDFSYLISTFRYPFSAST